jgi:hypothetical protein
VSAERHWGLGVRSTKRVSLLCAELHHAFEVLGVAWKRMSPYTYKCRLLIPGPVGRASAKLSVRSCHCTLDVLRQHPCDEHPAPPDHESWSPRNRLRGIP